MPILGLYDMPPEETERAVATSLEVGYRLTAMPASMADDWFSVLDASRYLGVPTLTLPGLIDLGHVAAYGLGRVIRLRRSDVVAFLQDERIEPGTGSGIC